MANNKNANIVNQYVALKNTRDMLVTFFPEGRFTREEYDDARECMIAGFELDSFIRTLYKGWHRPELQIEQVRGIHTLDWFREGQTYTWVYPERKRMTTLHHWSEKMEIDTPFGVVVKTVTVSYFTYDLYEIDKEIIRLEAEVKKVIGDLIIRKQQELEKLTKQIEKLQNISF